ncbi:DUF4233 domain-containing protein [Catenuloplanes sp. NPDC051500]|uniref:DUF4233 domain-containing protein n=1 Tax=Catenuloplanes sp. NPDC051500 TaxID=3363959 RepID=UPI0037A0FA7B
MTDEKKPSGLRNPAGAVRGLGAGTLIMEAIILLLAIQPIRLLGGDLGPVAIGLVITLTVAAIALAGLMGRAWAWHGGSAIQVALLAGGFLHYSLAALGVIFGLVWLYALHVRKTILS